MLAGLTVFQKNKHSFGQLDFATEKTVVTVSKLLILFLFTYLRLVYF
jgi:hypothetical protein